jgi:fatty acid/phospholipid biosynthesis enzyme
MGGDYAPEPIVKGTLMALEKFDNILSLFLVMKQKWLHF